MNLGCNRRKKASDPTYGSEAFLNAAGRGRTGTGITTHGILSPGRLPIPPLRRIHNEIVDGAYRARTYDPLLVRQMLSQLSQDPTDDPEETRTLDRRRDRAAL